MASNAHSSPEPAPSGDLLPPGAVLDRYRVEGKLREGGMAMVYLGEHVNTGARVALKVLKSDYAQQAEFVTRFDREAYVMGRLYDCPHIAQVHDVGELDDGRRFLAMEFVRGTDLDDLLVEHRSNDEPFDMIRACRLMRDVARGLEAAHQHKIVHRDLKPSNIMVEQRRGSAERAKLLDFGVSADLGDKGQAQGLTAAGTVIGTPEYMAPEQAAGIGASVSFDIYALGVVMFEVLAGRAPPNNGWRAGALPTVASIRPSIPAEIAALVGECLVMDATKRIQSAGEVAARLEAVIHDVEGPAAQLHRWADARPSAAAGTVRGVTGPLTPPQRPSIIIDPTRPTGPPLPGPPPASPVPPPPLAYAGPAATASPFAAPVPPILPTPPIPPTPRLPPTPPAAAAARPPAALARPARPPSSSNAVAIALALAVAAAGLFGAWTWTQHPDDDEQLAAESPPAPELQRESQTESQTESKTESQTESKTESQTEPKSESESKTGPDPNPDSTAVQPSPKTLPPKPRAASPKPRSASPKPNAGPRDPKPELPDVQADPQPDARSATPAAKPTSNCVSVREAANQARIAWQWSKVLSETRDATCWTGRANERRALRVEAFVELKRYDACIKAAGNSTDRMVKKRAAFCRKQLGQ